MDSFPEFIMYDDIFDMGSQAALEDTLLNHGRLCDQHSHYYTTPVPDYPISYIIGNIIAQYFNATLMTRGHSESIMKYPSYTVEVGVFGGIKQIGTVWSQFYPLALERNSAAMENLELPTFIKRSPNWLNFLYCSIPERKWSTPWKFSFFAVPFDKWTWLALFSLTFLVSLLVSASTRRSLVGILMSTLAATLENEMMQISNSKLYILWLFMTLVMSKLYLGEITSQVIAPPEDYRIENLSELEKRKYQFIFPDSRMPLLINRNIVNLRKTGFADQDLDVIARLLETAKSYGFKEYYDALVQTSQVSSLLRWSHAMMVAFRLNDVISVSKSNVKIARKTCQVGKKMFNGGELFLMFSPPGSLRMGRMFQRVLQAGIFQRWNQELDGMSYSSRVQDHARVKSWTSFVKESVPPETLKMEGKIVTIFLVWTFCHVACLTSLLSENLLYTCCRN